MQYRPGDKLKSALHLKKTDGTPLSCVPDYERNDSDLFGQVEFHLDATEGFDVADVFQSG